MKQWVLTIISDDRGKVAPAWSSIYYGVPKADCRRWKAGKLHEFSPKGLSFLS